METLTENFELLKNNRWAMSMTDAARRKDYLLRLKKEILHRREDIKAALYADFKKPYPESELTEIHTALDEINFAVKNLKNWMKKRKVPTPVVLFGSRSYIQYEAKGVVLVLAPWNYPFSLLINPLIAAIAAGNVVMAKPSEKTPATGKILQEICSAVFSASEVKVVTGDVRVAEALLKLPFDHIFFTGSPQVGKIVMEAASKNLTSVTLELGGKSPVVIGPDADLKSAASRITWGKFINGGQTCVAPDYVFVPEEKKEEFIDLVKKNIEESYGRDPEARKNSVDLARIIDQKALLRLKTLLDENKSVFPDQPDEVENYFPPTILKEIHPADPVMQEEIFGPVLPVLTYTSLEDVINLIREKTKPLALYVFARDKNFIRRLERETTSGGLAINQVILHLANPHLPFGGVGSSGMGSYHGFHGFKCMSHERSILVQSGLNLTSLYFPPYSNILKRFSFRMLKWFE